MANTKHYRRKPYETNAITTYWILFGVPIFVGLAVLLLATISGALYDSSRVGISLGVAFVLFTVLHAVVELPDVPGADVGEDRLFRVLRRLSRRFTLLNRIHLPCQRIRGGEAVLQAMVISKKAVYIIESNGKIGTVKMDGDEKNWGVSLGPNSESIEQIRNPVRQIKIKGRVLGEHLGAQGIALPIYPIVVFTADGVRLEGRDRVGIPVINEGPELLRVIRQIDKALPRSSEQSQRVIGYVQKMRNE